jgi:nucleotide-binding universal stress UspA family protein
MFHKVLFATDLTGISASATDYAVELAAKFGSHVTVVHAIEPLRSLSDDTEEEYAALYAKLRAGAAERGRHVLERFSARGVEATLSTPLGKRWEVVVQEAERLGSELIILGSQSIREGEKVYVGSTSHKVFLMAPCPVLVVKGA